MNLNEEQLEELSVMAGLFFEVEDIMINLDIPLHQVEDFEHVLKYEKEDPVYLAYHRGRLKTEVELRTAIKQASLNGSNPAQNTMLEFRNRTL
ncbi:hypothetical protein OU798_07440 [Prolixibacteraceae bacterium Z1-6]|uniref:Uncharacterized protein n=1 Tax=Draconibacterium aestuarii TaxID=2998507 RepID=A0A9X3FC41_9BACT|nr:hypothetical protein [Prolixibacteraceae bacterium Z1-6]